MVMLKQMSKMLFFIILSVTCLATSEGVSFQIKDVGCFSIGYASDFELGVRLNNFTLNNCFKFCTMKGTVYAGVYIREEMCYCGQYLVNNSIPFPKNSCNDPCPSGNQKCGGQGKMKVYQLLEEYVPTFLVGNGKGIIRLTGNDTEMLIPLNHKEDIYHIDYHYKRNEIYFTVGSKLYKSVYSFASFKYLEPKLLFDDKTSHQRRLISVDWVKNSLYFSLNTDLHTSELDGRNRTLFKELFKEHINTDGMDIDPYERTIFIYDSTNQRIREYGMDVGTEKRSPVHVQFALLKVDIHAQTIYGKSYNYLTKHDYGGGRSKKLNTVDGKTLGGISDIAVGLDGTVYFIHKLRRSCISKFILHNSKFEDHKCIPKQYGDIQTLQLYHEVKQAETKKVACANLHCAYKCAFTPQSYPRCVCPKSLHGANLTKCQEDVCPAGNYQQQLWHF